MAEYYRTIDALSRQLTKAVFLLKDRAVLIFQTLIEKSDIAPSCKETRLGQLVLQQEEVAMLIPELQEYLRVCGNEADIEKCYGRNRKIAKRIVQRQIKSLDDRKGFDHWWHQLDSEVQKEIRKELRSIVEDVLMQGLR